jgi:uncharacterized membrane protein
LDKVLKAISEVKFAQQLLQPDSAIVTKLAVASLGKFRANYASQVKQMLCVNKHLSQRNHMETSKNDKDILWRLTAEQRQQIYKEEKERIKQAAPTFLKKAIICSALYILGCVVILTGLIPTLTNYFDTGKWQYKADTFFLAESIEYMIGGAMLLLRPLVVGFATVFIIYMPVYLICLLIFDIDLTGKIKKYFKLYDEKETT